MGPSWLVPALEAVLLLGMFMATPHQLEHEHPRRRRVALGLTAFVTAANIYSLGALTHFLLHHNVSNGRELIVSGVLIWLTNFLIFGLWYWEMDRGGPGKRAIGRDGPPDFLFPQMNDDRIQPSGWRPKFIDYLYVSLTNATAFSPTDTMPLSAAAKGTMGIQATRLAGDDRLDRLARGEHPRVGPPYRSSRIASSHSARRSLLAYPPTCDISALAPAQPSPVRPIVHRS